MRIEWNCRVFIIRVLIFWYIKHKLCIKWKSVLSDEFAESNVIKQGGIYTRIVYYSCQYFTHEFK